MDRVIYALIGSLFGALVGVLGWWLYGLAHSLNYDGPAMDPVLAHWLRWSVAAHAILGFVLKDKIGDVIGDTLSAIFLFETNQTSGAGVRTIAALVYIAIVVAAIWHMTPRAGVTP